jgi:hypothetical protein
MVRSEAQSPLDSSAGGVQAASVSIASHQSSRKHARKHMYDAIHAPRKKSCSFGHFNAKKPAQRLTYSEVWESYGSPLQLRVLSAQSWMSATAQT